MGLKKYHAVLISSKDFWIFDPDSYDSTTKLYGDFTVIKGSSKKEDSDMKQCSYFFEIGNQDNHGFKPIAIKYDEAEGFLIVEGEQQPMGKNKKRVFQIGEEARRYKNMRGPRHSVDTIIVSRDSKKQEIKDYLKQQQDDSKSAETFQADTLNQINPIFVEGAEDVMGAESEIFCADCGGRRKYDAESLSADAYNKDGSFKFPKPYVDCEGCGLQEDGNCDCYLDEEMIKDAKKGICPSCEYDNFNINKPCEECEVVINMDGPKYRMDAESFEAEHSCGCGDEALNIKQTEEFEADGRGSVSVETSIPYEWESTPNPHPYENKIDEKLIDKRVHEEVEAALAQGSNPIGFGHDRFHEIIQVKNEDGEIEDEHIDFTYEFGADEFDAEQTLYWSHKRDKECSSCGYGKNHKAALLSDDGKLFSCYKCNSYPNEEEMVALYDAESFESEWVIEAVQQNLNDKDFVNYAYKVLIGGDAKTFEEKSMAIAETMNQNANNEDFTSFVENSLFKDAEDVVELVQEVSPFPMGKLFASFIVVGVSAIAGAKLLNR
jgi:hypothetical protein